MSDLLGAIIRDSKVAADPVAHAYASGNRPYLVRIDRPHTTPTFDRETLTALNAADEVIYTGPARFSRASGGTLIDLGDERTTLTTVRVSIDDTGGAPRVDDIIVVLDDPAGLARSTDALGRTFTVLDVEIGGHYDIGHVMTAQGAAPSRRT